MQTATNRRNYLILSGSALFFITLLFHQSAKPIQDSFERVTEAGSFLRTQQCPNPFTIIHAPPLRHQTYECFPIITNSTYYNAKICMNKIGVCNVGHVDVEMIDQRHCQFLNDNRDASPNPEMNHYIKSHLGPDTFSVLFDGPARDVGQLEYLGSCKYRYHYNLKNGGDFSVRIIQVYDIYRGLDEMNQNSWQPIINESILSEDFHAPPSCPSRCIRHEYDPTSSLLASRKRCHTNEQPQGTWLPTFSPNSSTPPYSFGHFSPYNFISSCKLKTTAVDYKAPAIERARCFGKTQKVLLTGDSHLRWLFDGLVSKMAGSMQGKSPAEAKFGKAQEKGNVIAGLSLNWWADPVLSTLRDEVISNERYSSATHIIVTCVQWLVHQPFHEFKAHIDTLLRNIETFSNNHPEPPKFVWFNSPAWPDRSDEDVKSHNDTRTNPRIRAMNEYATLRFKLNGYGSIDAFKLSEGFIHGDEGPDNAHWYSTPVMDVLHDYVANELDLC